jgi:asparagine synthase (glutamine-hydrolysing)
MCGINGFNFEDEDIAKAMNASIIHRGPDNQSVWGNKSITLGHVRLSIIDLSNNGNQPLHYETKHNKYTIVFNGEIYNYIEIRNELKLNNYNFKSDSDTEVILAAYDFWGENCVQRFNGMWSFCIFNYKENLLFCSRDRLGVKPFCYYFKNGQFIFSSEIKAILEHKSLNINSYNNINIDAVNLYFSSGMIPAPYTIYKDVYKLESGHNLILDLNKLNLKKYKYLNIKEQKLTFNKNELFEEMDYLFNDSIKLRMRSDVPVGSFLSGGVDSTSIVYGIMNNNYKNSFHTFSIGFEGKYDETSFINLAHKSTNLVHHHEYYHKKNWQNDRELYAYVFDEPFGDSSGYPTLHVSKMAKKHVTVVQSGDGGDEIFGGYPIYGRALIIEHLYKLPYFLRVALISIIKKTNFKHLKYPLEGLKISVLEKNNFLTNYLKDERLYTDEYKKWTTNKLIECIEQSNGSLSDALRLFDLLYDTLPDRFLTKVDKASMYNSIEVRSPFLDYRFIEFSQKIPNIFKYYNGNTKILLKEYVNSRLSTIPKAIIIRKKQGFTPPIQNWIIEDYDFKENKQLEYIKFLCPQVYEFYKILFLNNQTNSSKVEYFIKLRIFNDWFERWVKT